MNPPLRLIAAYYELTPTQPEWLLPVPGREMWLAAGRISQGHYRLFAPDYEGQTTFDVRTARRQRTLRERPLPRWARYSAGVAVLLHDAGWVLPGVQAVLAGDETPGPRYEYALGMAFAQLWYTVNAVDATQAMLIETLERVHPYV